MKRLKIIFFVFFIMLPISCFTEDLSILIENIHQIKNEINENQNNSKALLRAYEKLQMYLPVLQKCRQNQHLEISKIKESLTLLDEVQNDERLMIRKKDTLALLKK